VVKVGSLFSGIGGLDLGLERAGMKVIWQVEKDPYCQKVLAKHWPGVPCYGDIKEIDFTTLPPVDLICGGFPCQPVSCAGKRQGDQDERWLWPEFYRAICEARPRWVLVENVPGLLSASDGRLFGGILRDLARSGYDAEWDLLPAAAFGAPHLRFRLFLVAYARSSPGFGRAPEPGRETERGIAAGGHGEVVADAELRRWNKGGESAERQEGIKVERLRRCGRTENVADAGCSSGSSWRHIFSHGQKAPGERETSGIEGCSLNRTEQQWLIEPDVGRVAHGVSKRVDRLKCLGNAVVPQVVEWIGRRILEIDEQGEIAV
jgi:DNA (cytosine-5)-methyltransferase 1